MSVDSNISIGHCAEKRGIFSEIIIGIIRCYQVAISPILGRHCRFYPSCSAYCISAIEKYGCLKGVMKGIIRLCKCHPFHPGGVDFA